MQQIDVVIIGAGQAGLAVSHELTGLGVELCLSAVTSLRRGGTGGIASV